MTLAKRFRATVAEGHKGCAVLVPFDPAAAWGEQPTQVVYQRVRGIAVSGRLDRIAFESWIIRRWGKVFLLLSDEVLERAGRSPGDPVSISVQPR